MDGRMMVESRMEMVIDNYPIWRLTSESHPTPPFWGGSDPAAAQNGGWGVCIVFPYIIKNPQKHRKATLSKALSKTKPTINPEQKEV